MHEVEFVAGEQVDEVLDEPTSIDGHVALVGDMQLDRRRAQDQLGSEIQLGRAEKVGVSAIAEHRPVEPEGDVILEDAQLYVRRITKERASRVVRSRRVREIKGEPSENEPTRDVALAERLSHA